MRPLRTRVVAVVALVTGLGLAAYTAYEMASVAAFAMWWDGLDAGRATAYALLLAGGVALGAAMLVAGAVETLRGAAWGLRAIGVAVAVTALAWVAIPVVAEPVGSIVEVDAYDPVRFRHSLRFSGDLEGELKGARFVLTIAGFERTCGPERRAFSLWQVRGTVGDREVTLWISIDPYDGPGVYRARHEFGKDVADKGQAGLIVEDRDYQSWYPMSGSITVGADERSGSVDATNGPLPNMRSAKNKPIRVTGTWQCLPPLERPREGA